MPIQLIILQKHPSGNTLKSNNEQLAKRKSFIIYVKACGEPINYHEQANFTKVLSLHKN